MQKKTHPNVRTEIYLNVEKYTYIHRYKSFVGLSCSIFCRQKGKDYSQLWDTYCHLAYSKILSSIVLECMPTRVLPYITKHYYVFVVFCLYKTLKKRGYVYILNTWEKTSKCIYTTFICIRTFV